MSATGHEVMAIQNARAQSKTRGKDAIKGTPYVPLPLPKKPPVKAKEPCDECRGFGRVKGCVCETCKGLGRL